MTYTTAPRKKNVPAGKAKNTAASAPQPAAWMHQHFYATLILTALVSVGLTILAPRAYAALVASTSNTATRQMTGRHFILPTNERPAVITVTNANSLDIPFLEGAEEGDKVLVYQQNQLAVLYRPSADKIVTVGPLTD